MNITLACPSCGKKNTDTAKCCARCSCALEALFQIKAQAEYSWNQAARDLRENRFTDCLQSCEHSWQHYPSAKTAQLAFIAAVLHGDTFQAMRWKWRTGN